MKPKIALVQCPPWTVLGPPLHLGYLVAYLRENRYPVIPFDFNIETYEEASDDQRYFWSRDLDSRWINDNASFLHKKMGEWARKVLDSEAAVIGVNFFQDGRDIALELVKRIKDEDKTRLVVAGGPECHPGYRTRQFLNQKGIDVFVTGEGETTILDIVRQYEKKGKVEFCPGAIIRRGNKLIDCGPRAPIRDLDSLPFPDLEDFPLKKYEFKEEIPILFSRGCIGRCAFCQDIVNAGPYRCRSAQNIADEMRVRLQQGYRIFFVNDLMANGDAKQLDALSRHIIQSDLRDQVDITGQMRCRKEMTPSVYRNLHSAGWKIIIHGVESGSQRILNLMRKGYKIEDAEKNLRDCHNAGIETKINIIVGFPGETEETFQETLDFLRRNRANIDTLGALYDLDLRDGSHVATHYKEYSIVSNNPYWKTTDGKNTYGWRLELKYQVLKLANSLGIRIAFDDVHFYFYHALDYYHNHLKDYGRSYEIMMDALQYLDAKLKKKTTQDGRENEHNP